MKTATHRRCTECDAILVEYSNGATCIAPACMLAYERKKAASAGQMLVIVNQPPRAGGVAVMPSDTSAKSATARWFDRLTMWARR